MVDTFFEELVSDKSFIETCNILRSHVIRHDQQNKEKNARQIHNTYQLPGTGTTKKDNIKTILEIINELQFQDSDGSDDELNNSKLSKTVTVYKLVQVTSEIWVTLPFEAKKWLLNERKFLQKILIDRKILAYQTNIQKSKIL
jgi:hypothetical protein